MAILTRMVSTTLGGHEGFHQNRRSESTKPDGLKHSAFWSADSIGRSSPNASIMLASIFTRTHVPIYVCVFVCVNVFVCVCVETRNRCSQTPRVLETPLPILHNLCLAYTCPSKPPGIKFYLFPISAAFKSHLPLAPQGLLAQVRCRDWRPLSFSAKHCTQWPRRPSRPPAFRIT